MRAVGVARELNNIRIFQPQNFLESPSNVLQNFLALRGRAALIELVTGDALAHSPGPQTDTVEALANVDHDTHDFIVVIVLKSLANGSQLSVQPKIIDRHRLLVLERVRPFATVFVLLVLPLWSYALLKEVVVGFQSKLRGWCDVVLRMLVDVDKYR